MSLPEITPFVNPPDRAEAGSDFGTALAAWIASLNLSVASFNAFMAAIQAQVPAAIGAISEPADTEKGDMITYSDPSAPARLGIGGQGQVLTPISGVPGWGEAPVGGECRLDYTSATVLTLVRYNGYRLVIDNVTRAVPSAGVALANPGVADTTYFIYAYWTGSVIALEYNATGYSADSRNGVMTKTGDTTRSLVGMARTNASGQWVSSQQQRFVISWYNRKSLLSTVALASNFSTASPSPVATGASFEFLSWAGYVHVGVRASASNTNVDAVVYTSLHIDAAGAHQTRANEPVANIKVISFSASLLSIAEGHHDADIRAYVSAGTGTWIANDTTVFLEIIG